MEKKKKPRILLFLILSILMLGCNNKASNNSFDKQLKNNLNLDSNIIDSIAALECECYNKALLIEDSYKMKLHGLNCYKYLANYLTSKNYINNDMAQVKAFQKDMFDLVGEITYNNCNSLKVFFATLNEKRERDIYLIENPELMEIAKKGKFVCLEIEDSIILTICYDYVRTEFKDFGYYSLSTIEWIDEFSYYEIFQETDHPFYSWRTKHDTIVVNTINIRDSIIEYDITSRFLIYPGVIKRIN